jgi:hypothetical protein
MKYVLLAYDNPANWTALSQRKRRILTRDRLGFDRELASTGELVHAVALTAPTRTRTFWSRKRLPATDGPFSEAKEQLAGFIMIDCTDDDRANAIGVRLARLGFDAVELRPVQDMSGSD